MYTMPVPRELRAEEAAVLDRGATAVAAIAAPRLSDVCHDGGATGPEPGAPQRLGARDGSVKVLARTSAVGRAWTCDGRTMKPASRQPRRPESETVRKPPIT